MKNAVKGMILLLLVAMFGFTLTAQNTAAPAVPAAKPAQPAMTTPRAAPEMTKMIKMMAGTWSVAEKLEPGPMFPNGGTGKGTSTLTPGPGGMSLNESYHSSGTMGPNFTGFGVFWWDSKAQYYHGMWCDNLTPDGCNASGIFKWEGDKLVGNMPSDMNGQKTVTQYVLSDWKPNSFMMTMAMGPDTSKLTKMMTVTYTRSSAVARSDSKPGMTKP